MIRARRKWYRGGSRAGAVRFDRCGAVLLIRNETSWPQGRSRRLPPTRDRPRRNGPATADAHSPRRGTVVAIDMGSFRGGGSPRQFPAGSAMSRATSTRRVATAAAPRCARPAAARHVSIIGRCRELPHDRPVRLYLRGIPGRYAPRALGRETRPGRSVPSCPSPPGGPIVGRIGLRCGTFACFGRCGTGRPSRASGSSAGRSRGLNAPAGSVSRRSRASGAGFETFHRRSQNGFILGRPARDRQGARWSLCGRASRRASAR